MSKRFGRAAIAATTVLVGATSLTLPPQSASAAVASVDLADYVRVGRYDLPEPTRTAAPPDSLLAQEASSVTYNWDTDTLFVTGDGGTSVVQVDKSGNLIDSMTLAPGGSPQGTEFYDTEGIAYVGGGQFALIEERDRQVNLFTYVPGGVLNRADAQTVKLGTTIGNIGLEGVTYDPQTGGFVFVKELTPQGMFQTGIDWGAGTATNGSTTTENSVNLFDPALLGLGDLSDVYALSNIPSLAGSSQEGSLLVLSQESGRVVLTDRTGAISSELTLYRDPSDTISIPAMTIEGVTMDRDGNLFLVNENGGGDANHPQLWVYSPSAAPNQAPSALTLTPASTSIAENTDTTARIQVADLWITDTADGGKGTNHLDVTGADASAFQVDSNGLYIAPGTVLDFETKSSYDVTVQVDDTTVGGSPDATASFHLEVTDVPDGAGRQPSAVYISEVSARSSSEGSYGADWFELTNTGAARLDLTGWRMNDDTNDYGTGAELLGVPTLAPGESAVFVEGDSTTVDGFVTAWFAGSKPAGLQIGHYSGSGVGLSSGGDAVAVFDALGARQAGVSFGTTTSHRTFDNSVGAGTTDAVLPAIAVLSESGTNGAFSSSDAEVGSPGLVGAHAVITEVAAWASGNAPYGADWFELTNTGDFPLDVTGWRMNDDTATFASGVPMLGITSVAPDESVIFIESDGPVDPALGDAFSSAWLGTATVPSGLRLGYYGGSGVGLSTGGDAVTVFDVAGDLVTGVSFGAATTGYSLDNRSGLGGPTLPLAAIDTVSARGIGGAFVAADGIETGSPGATAAHLVITELAPWASGNAPYAADWFEVSNPGPFPVDLSGWMMDDSSNDIAKAVALRGVAVVAPAASAIFIKGQADGTTDQSNRTAFSETWFGTTVAPLGLQIGGYGGSGVGLSTGGDGVHLFDGASEHVAGVSFGASTAGVTFDNTAGSAVVATLSDVGVNGAFSAPDGEVGSPLPDTTAPVLGACPVAGPFALMRGDQPVGPIAATDDVAGVDPAASALTASVTTGVLGLHVVTFVATDRGGNAASVDCSYDVAATTTIEALIDDISRAADGASTRDARFLRKASSALAQALAPSRWSDPNHLADRHASHVFEDTLDAVQALRQVRNLDGALIETWIDTIVALDRNLATIAIDEASPRDAAKATRLLEVGDWFADRGVYAAAIGFYGAAWELAR